MRFLVDAQLPSALCSWLEARGHQAVYSPVVLAGDTPDQVIARYAAEQQLVVLTKDEDFPRLRGQHDFVLVWLRCGNMRNADLYRWLESRFALVERLLEQGEQSVILR